jgi:ribose 1,5-bisphosphate isomerase
MKKPKKKIKNPKAQPKLGFGVHRVPMNSVAAHKKAKLKSKAKHKPKPKHVSKHKTAKKAKPKRPASTPSSRPKPSNYMPKIDSIIEDIASLKIQGAKDIALAGIKCIKIVATDSAATKTDDFVEELKKVAEKASAARPTEPALRNCMGTILGKVDRYELRRIQNIKKYAAMACDRLSKDIEAMMAKMAAIGAGNISEGDTILTHCHSNHVIAILKEAKAQKKNFRVIVTETEPLRQGIMTAKELLEAKIPVTYCVDSAIGAVMKRVDKVLVGCDAILADGSIVNKIGTLPIAIVAAKFNTPVFVAGESIKFDGQTVSGRPEPLETRSPAEISQYSELKGAEVINPAFDIVPAELITALITELGVMRPELLRQELGF